MEFVTAKEHSQLLALPVLLQTDATSFLNNKTEIFKPIDRGEPD